MAYRRIDSNFYKDPFRRSDWIEHKESLLEWIDSRSSRRDTGSMENHLCIASILKRSNWQFSHEDYLWRHPDHGGPYQILQALRIEIAHQIDRDKKWHLGLVTGNNSHQGN